MPISTSRTLVIAKGQPRADVKRIRSQQHDPDTGQVLVDSLSPRSYTLDIIDGESISLTHKQYLKVCLAYEGGCHRFKLDWITINHRQHLRVIEPDSSPLAT